MLTDSQEKSAVFLKLENDTAWKDLSRETQKVNSFMEHQNLFEQV